MVDQKGRQNRGTPLWQKLIWTVMFLVVFEGAIRKWIVPGFQAQVYLLKDGLLCLAYIDFLSSRAVSPPIHLKIMGGLKVLLMLSFLYFTLQVLNPNSPSVVLSIVGLKNYLLYAPLVFIVPHMFLSAKDLESKLRKYALIMIPLAALGLVQFSFGSDHWINGYLDHDSENLRLASMFGSEGTEKARTSGTFSYIGGYTTFLTVTLFLGLGLAASQRWQLSASRWYVLLVIVSVAAIFTTGSRGSNLWISDHCTSYFLYMGGQWGHALPKSYKDGCSVCWCLFGCTGFSS